MFESCGTLPKCEFYLSVLPNSVQLLTSVGVALIGRRVTGLENAYY